MLYDQLEFLEVLFDSTCAGEEISGDCYLDEEADEEVAAGVLEGEWEAAGDDYFL